ncbi:HAD-like protein [Glonium stellatum]|uniref:Mitochondrial import inner membrane translocase subunit TIM50 n=1 Tax=Glonium stellatum TaxID=574774 RepID=A0A8E2EMY8_9PEZI|nr:HAD-like protein [Glonium stellatum]
MLTQWELSDSPPNGDNLQNSTVLHSTPSNSGSFDWTLIKRSAVINESAQRGRSPAPKASPKSRNSPAPPGRKRHSSPKMHLPAPAPTKEYLEQAAKAPERLDRPQRPLLVLDLNGTLVYRPGRSTTEAIPRPFLQPFLKYIFENFSVMVWSSAKPHNVKRMVQSVLTPKRLSLLIAEWGRDRFGLTEEQYTQNVQVYKELSRIWKDAAITNLHPEQERGRGWGQHNTILLDDSELKASSEPFNLVQIPEFIASEKQMRGDVLREVAGYLDEVRMQKDVSAFIKRTPFEADGRWNIEWPDEVSEGVAITI